MMQGTCEQYIINGIARFLIEKNIIFTPVEKKNIAKIDNHIKAMIYSMLSNQKRWELVVPKLAQIDELFFHYNKDSILSFQPEYFENGIRLLKCGNRSTKAQMASLHSNIQVFEYIEKEHGSIDAFFNAQSIPNLVAALSSKGSSYKLAMMGEALIYEYLKNLGYDAVKPDLHVRRILGSERLGFSMHPSASVTEVHSIIDQFVHATGETRAYIDFLLWSYCSQGYGEVCTANPSCYKCTIKQYCVKGGDSE